MADPIDEEVPKLPRGRGIRLSLPQLVRILGLAAVLVVLLVMQKPCSNAVSSFVTGFDGSAAGKHAASGSASGPNGAGVGAGGAGSGAGTLPLERYEHLRPDMTDAELKATIERAKVKAGSAAPATSP